MERGIDMERLRFERCKKCGRWNGKWSHCMEICLTPYYALDEFNRYKELEEQGLLLKLPCKVGDTIYSVEFRDSAEIILEKVDSFKITGNDIWVFGKYDKFIRRLGGSVFATKEEAEAKLKEMEGES